MFERKSRIWETESIKKQMIKLSILLRSGLDWKLAHSMMLSFGNNI